MPTKQMNHRNGRGQKYNMQGDIQYKKTRQLGISDNPGINVFQKLKLPYDCASAKPPLITPLPLSPSI